MDLIQRIKSNARSIQILLFALTILYLSFLLPNKPGFNYRYGIHTVWQYDDLYAPVDFSVKRDSIQLDSLKRLVWDQSIPYFNLDTSLVKEITGRVDAILENQYIEFIRLDNLTNAESIKKLRLNIVPILQSAYKKGVIQESENQELKPGNRIFYLLDHEGEASIQRKEQYITINELKDNVKQEFANHATQLDGDYFPLVSDIIKANIIHDYSTTERIRQAELDKISPFGGKMEKGELIVRRGARITPETLQKLESLKEVLLYEGLNKQGLILIYIGNLLVISLIMGLFYLYLRFVEPEMLFKTRKIIFLLMWFVLFSTLVYFVEGISSLSAYIVPFCIVPIVIKNFMNERLAYITVIVLIMIASLITSLGLDYALLMVLAGLVAVLFGTETRYWARFFNSIFIIFLTFLLGNLGLSLIRGDGLLQINWTIYSALLVNVVLTLLAYPAIPLLEQVFGFTSAITLAELSDINKPLLKKLSIKAPGTFQHSIQVSNLAEAAASKIGANSLLAKVGSLYHDIGKMKHPMHFIENAGAKSMHDKIDPMESARIIMEHVSEGVNLAKEYRIPQVVIEFIKTHHGTTRVEFFLHKYKQLYPQDKDAETKFTYPGPRPKTKEQSIVMLADSIEAASKILKFKNYSELDAFVDKIIEKKLQSGQLDHSELSFEELEISRKVFKKTLRSIYHGRISYPDDALPST